MPAKRSQLIAIRVPNEMADAIDAAAAAAGIKKSLWLRRLVERELGIKADMPIGVAAMDEKQKAARAVKFRKTIAQRKQAKQVEKKS